VSGHRVAAVILAAGLSARLPGNKLLQPIAGRPMVRCAVEAALASYASEVLVVTGHQSKRLRNALSDVPVVIVENQSYTDGLSTSLKCGVRHVPADCDGALILLADMPFITAAVLNRLLAHFDPAAGREICVPVAGGRRGNPVLWGRRFFAELLAITGDKGGRHLMELHQNSIVELELDDRGVLIDIDTAADFESIAQ
jgi:molybdenum cofactor cytidylyltransferase